MEQHFVKFSLIIEGASKKVSPFKMSLEPINKKNFCFVLSTVIRFKKINNLSNTILNGFVYLFRAALYKLSFV